MVTEQAIQGAIQIADSNEPVLSADAIEYYYDRWDEFVDDNIIWPAKRYIPDAAITPDQRDVLKKIGKYPRGGLESGHGTGKSTLYAWAAIAFLCTRYNTLGQLVKVPCVAPTHHQLYDVLWPEVKRWLAMSRLKQLITLNTEEMWYNGAKDSCYARCRSVSKSDNLSGFHATHLLWLVDEAFGVTNQEIWLTIEGSLTEPDNKLLFGGQHTVLIGFCHEAFHRDIEAWTPPNGFLKRLDSEKSPLAKPEFAMRIARRYGKDSDVYRVRVKGMEPKGNPDAFIQLQDVEAARVREVPGSGVIEMGVDCARFGDDLFAVTTRHGWHVFPQFTLPRSDTYQMYDAVIQEARKYRKLTGFRGTIRIKVDATGGYGGGLIDMLLRNRTDNIEVIPVTFGAGGNDEYADNITIMWAEMRDALPYMQIEDYDGVEFLVDELSTRRKKIDEKTGWERIESKDDYKSEYEASPDRADSLVLCCSNAAAPKRVLPFYHSTNPAQHKVFNIEWDKVEKDNVQVYVCLVLEKTLGLSGGIYFWGRKSKTLRQYAEICQLNPTAKSIAEEIRGKCGCGSRDLRDGFPYINRILGNEAMFDKKKDFPYMLRKDGKFKIDKALNYNINGSRVLANKMFSNGEIILHTCCEETNRQWERWILHNGQPDKGFPLCESVLMVVSELKEKGEMKESEELKPYGQQKKKLHDSLYNKEYEKNFQIRTTKARSFSSEYTC